LWCVAVAAGAVPDAGDAGSLLEALTAALEANRQFAEVAEELRRDYARVCEENALLRERAAERDAEVERLRAEVAVLQRLVFGRSSERSGKPRPEPPDGGSPRPGGWRGREEER
jgi:transposase